MRIVTSRDLNWESVRTLAPLGLHSSHMPDVYIVSATRTPVGSFQGALKSQSAVDLGVSAARAAIERARLAPADIEEAFLGCVLQGGVGQAPARQVVLRAGCPVSTEATTVNKVCASGMKAISFAVQSLRLGDRSIVLVGGMESMSNAPYYLKRGGLAFGDASATDAILADGLTDASEHQSMGVCVECTARKHECSRADQDAFAIESYDRAARAWESGAFDAEIVPIIIEDRQGKVVVREDEEFRRLKREKLTTLRPAFIADGTVTAANASSINDGASALVLANAEAVAMHHLHPLARVLGTYLGTARLTQQRRMRRMRRSTLPRRLRWRFHERSKRLESLQSRWHCGRSTRRLPWRHWPISSCWALTQRR